AGAVPSTTIHALLEAVPGPTGFTFRRERENPLEQRLVILDEASMVDVSLFVRLLDAIDFARTSLLLVGDLNQLPPVGAGAPLRDLVESDSIANVELTEIVRNSGLITAACAAIRRGERFAPAGRYVPSPGRNVTNVVHYPGTPNVSLAALVER